MSHVMSLESLEYYDEKIKEYISAAAISNGIEYIVGTVGSANNKWLGVTQETSLQVGKVIAYKIPAAGTSAQASLDLTLADGTTTGEILVYRMAASTVTSQYSAGCVIMLVYEGSGSGQGWRQDCSPTDTNTICAAYIDTAARTAAKVGTTSYYTATANTYTYIVLNKANSAQNSALTLNINGQGAKPIYINGSPTSPTNYTLPAGTYLIYYDGTNYYFNTDGTIYHIHDLIAAKQDQLTAGTGIAISNNTISAQIPVSNVVEGTTSTATLYYSSDGSTMPSSPAAGSICFVKVV